MSGPSDPPEPTDDRETTDTTDATSAEPEAPPAPLLTLRDGLPEITETDAGLADVVARVAAGTGPIALDAERASGYRYSPRAYLIQLRREGSGTALIDPIAFDDLTSLERGHRRRRVDPARRQPGPPLPARGRAGAGRGSSTPSWPRGCSATRASAWPPWSRSSWAARCARSTPRSTGRSDRCPQPWLEYAALDVEVLARAARRDRRGADRVGQGRLGRAGVPAPHRPRPAAAAGPVASYVRHPQGQGTARPRRRTRALDRPATRSPPQRDTTPGPADPRLRAHRRRQHDADAPPPRCWTPRASTAAVRGATPTSGSPPWCGRGSCATPSCRR